MKLIFDVETTGLDPVHDEILQLAIIDQDKTVLFHDYFRPRGIKAWPEAQRINHISPDMVKGKKTFRQRRHEIQDIFNRADELIAYNTAFDMSFLAYGGIVFPDVPVSDPMLDFAPIYGEWNEYYYGYKWQKLTTAAHYYNYEFAAHDSLEDVRATLHVYNALHT